MSEIKNLRERIVDAARSWYRNAGNAEAELAALLRELEGAAAVQGPDCALDQPPEMISRNAAIEIARAAAAGVHRPPYYAEPFQPHEWVVDAIRLASARAP
jgi:hypothetical protein